jgi:hypothetical protein
LLTSNYGALEESNGKLSSSHDDLLVSYNRLKLAHESMSKVTSCEPHVGTSTTSQNAILPCANPVVHPLILLLYLVVNYLPCLVALTMKIILPLILVLLLTM